MSTNQTQQQQDKRPLTSEITLKINQYTKIFEKCVREEIEIQKQLGQQYPEFVLRIISDSNEQLKNEIKIKITYDCTVECQTILKYAENLVDDQVLEKKIQLCCQLLKICKWMKQNKIAHRNIKPSSLYVVQGKVLLRDFGSQRTFFQNYYYEPTDVEEKNQKFRHCLFYQCPEILEIIKNNSDSDLRMDELKEWLDFQEEHAAIKADIWSIAIIILEIFFPIKDIAIYDINEYYGLNKKNLQNQLDKFEKNEIGNCLSILLNKDFNLKNFNFEDSIQLIMGTKNKNNQQKLVHIQDEEEIDIQILETNLQKFQQPNFQFQYFISLKDFNNKAISLNFQNEDNQNLPQLDKLSIINFAEYDQKIKEASITFLNQQMNRSSQNFLNEKIEQASQKFQTQQLNQSSQNLSQYYPTLEENKAKEETYKSIQVLRNLLLTSQAIKKFYNSNDSQKPNQLLSYDVLILMTNTQLNDYQQTLENLLKSSSQQDNEQIEKINNAKVELGWRFDALKLLNSQEEFPYSGTLIFYLNDEEYKQFREQNNEKYLKINESLRGNREELQKAITDFLCFNDNSFTLEQLQNVSMAVIQNTDDKLLQIRYNEKLNIKKQLGIEWFEFHKDLYPNYKFEKFLEKGDIKFVIKNKTHFDCLSKNRQTQYKEKLKEIIKNNPTEDNEKWCFYIYERLSFYNTQTEEIMPKMKFQKNQFDFTQISTNISQVIKAFSKQLLVQSMRIPIQYEIYFRKLDIKEINNFRQLFNNLQVNSYYYGNYINDIPNGFGYSVINQKTVLLGIYRNGKLIKGWSIIEKRTKKWITSIIKLNKGQFSNGLLNGKGIKKVYLVNQQNNIFRFRLLRKKQGEFQNGKLNGKGSKIIYDPNRKITISGEFTANQFTSGYQRIGDNNQWIQIQNQQGQRCSVF